MANPYFTRHYIKNGRNSLLEISAWAQEHFQKLLDVNSLSSTNVKAICAIVPIELTACTCVIWLASVPKVYTVFGAK